MTYLRGAGKTKSLKTGSTNCYFKTGKGKEEVPMLLGKESPWKFLPNASLTNEERLMFQCKQAISQKQKLNLLKANLPLVAEEC